MEDEVQLWNYKEEGSDSTLSIPLDGIRTVACFPNKNAIALETHDGKLLFVKIKEYYDSYDFIFKGKIFNETVAVLSFF